MAIRNGLKISFEVKQTIFKNRWFMFVMCEVYLRFKVTIFLTHNVTDILVRMEINVFCLQVLTKKVYRQSITYIYNTALYSQQIYGFRMSYDQGKMYFFELFQLAAEALKRFKGISEQNLKNFFENFINYQIFIFFNTQNTI